MDHGLEIRPQKEPKPLNPRQTSELASKPNTAKVPFWKSFGRAQVASFSATLVDFGMLLLLVEVFFVWYALARAISALCGGVTNFLMNRSWSFEVSDRLWKPQAFRYALVSLLSLLLNTWGTYFLTETFHFKYWLSAGVVSLLVGFFFNFPLHRNFVFR